MRKFRDWFQKPTAEIDYGLLPKDHPAYVAPQLEGVGPEEAAYEREQYERQCAKVDQMRLDDEQADVEMQQRVDFENEMADLRSRVTIARDELLIAIGYTLGNSGPSTAARKLSDAINDARGLGCYPDGGRNA